MNYSKALNECIESAYMVASHFGADYLESWHLLIAMANHGYSVAGATLNDYPYEIDRLEEVASELTETVYNPVERYKELPFSHRLEVLFAEAEYVASVVHAKILGTEHVLYAILHDGNALATRILERAGFSYEDILQLLFEQDLLTKQEMNLLLSVALDRVLGEEAPVLRANMLRQVIQEVDRKGK